jgi:hypothetical protein
VATADQVLPEVWNTPHAAGGADPDTGRPLEATASAASTDDRIARLEKLGELRDAGLLTEDEFQAQKGEASRPLRNRRERGCLTDALATSRRRLFIDRSATVVIALADRLERGLQSPGRR